MSASDGGMGKGRFEAINSSFAFTKPLGRSSSRNLACRAPEILDRPQDCLRISPIDREAWRIRSIAAEALCPPRSPRTSQLTSLETCMMAEETPFIILTTSVVTSERSMASRMGGGFPRPCHRGVIMTITYADRGHLGHQLIISVTFPSRVNRLSSSESAGLGAKRLKS
ncbi:hypothetical protein AB1N83_010985 [Pleurotus pulmonarius]